MRAIEVDIEDIIVARYLELQGEVCPFTYVKTKLALESIESGDILVIVLDQGEPIENVPRSVKDEGHHIIKVERDGTAFKLWIKKS